MRLRLSVLTYFFHWPTKLDSQWLEPPPPTWRWAREARQANRADLKAAAYTWKHLFFSTSRFIDRQNGSQNYQNRDRVAAESFRARAQELFGKQVGRIGFIASCHIASISGKCRRRSTCCFPARRMCSVSSLSYLGVYTWPAQEWHVDTRTALTIQNTPFSSYNTPHCSAVHQCKMKRSRGIVHDKLDNTCSTLLPSCQSLRFVLPRPVAGIRQRDIFSYFSSAFSYRWTSKLLWIPILI